ncbi:hypothetical protein CsSME_00050471 [Camellia sinensis var. sinensis]
MWTDEEDRELVYALFDMVNTGNHKLPGCGIKAKPHVESRVKTLKSDTGTVFDMVNRVGCSGFGWDSNKNMVVAEKQVWDGYVVIEVIGIYEPNLNSVIIIDHNVFLSIHVKSTFAMIVKLMSKLLHKLLTGKIRVSHIVTCCASSSRKIVLREKMRKEEEE